MSNSSITDSHLGGARAGKARVAKITTSLVWLADGSNHAKLAPTLATSDVHLEDARQKPRPTRPMKRRAFLFTRSFLILAAFTSYGDFIFSSSESVIQDKAINDSTPADLFTVKVDFGINFLDWRI